MKTEDKYLEKLAHQFKILGDKTRLKILMLLKDKELPVNKIVEQIKTTQANVSKHLKLLHKHGIVKKKQVKSSVFYSIKKECIFEICDILYTDDKSALDTTVKMINQDNEKSE